MWTRREKALGFVLIFSYAVVFPLQILRASNWAQLEASISITEQQHEGAARAVGRCKLTSC